MATKRLGRGLEALIPQISEEEEAKFGDSLSDIEVSDIKTNPHQPRLEFDRERLEELKQSIQENGIIQPLTVRKTDGGYELIAGERRFRAIQELGFPKVPAFVMQVKSDQQMLELALVENIQRENLNPIDLAKAYQALQKEYGMTQEEVAKKVGKERATVANSIRLLKLPSQIQESLKKGEISMGHARALMGLSGRGEQVTMWNNLLKKGWSVRQLEKEVRRQIESGGVIDKKASAKSDAAYAGVEEELRTLLGTQVKIKSSGQGGKIEIAYYSPDDLERLIELFQSISL